MLAPLSLVGRGVGQVGGQSSRCRFEAGPGSQRSRVEPLRLLAPRDRYGVPLAAYRPFRFESKFEMPELCRALPLPPPPAIASDLVDRGPQPLALDLRVPPLESHPSVSSEAPPISILSGDDGAPILGEGSVVPPTASALRTALYSVESVQPPGHLLNCCDEPMSSPRWDLICVCVSGKFWHQRITLKRRLTHLWRNMIVLQSDTSRLFLCLCVWLYRWIFSFLICPLHR